MMEQRSVLQPLWFFRQTLMFKARLRHRKRGVIFSITKKREGSPNFQQGDEVTISLSLVEIGKLLLFPHKSVLDKKGGLVFIHQLRNEKGEKLDGKVITFRPKEDGEVEFSIRHNDRETRFTFSAAEWIMLKIYLQEAVRQCFYLPPVGGSAEEGEDVVENDDVDVGETDDANDDYEPEIMSVI